MLGGAKGARNSKQGGAGAAKGPRTKSGFEPTKQGVSELYAEKSPKKLSNTSDHELGAGGIRPPKCFPTFCVSAPPCEKNSTKPAWEKRPRPFSAPPERSPTRTGVSECVSLTENASGAAGPWRSTAARCGARGVRPSDRRPITGGGRPMAGSGFRRGGGRRTCSTSRRGYSRVPSRRRAVAPDVDNSCGKLLGLTPVEPISRVCAWTRHPYIVHGAPGHPARLDWRSGESAGRRAGASFCGASNER